VLGHHTHAAICDQVVAAIRVTVPGRARTARDRLRRRATAVTVRAPRRCAVPPRVHRSWQAAAWRGSIERPGRVFPSPHLAGRAAWVGSASLRVEVVSRTTSAQNPPVSRKLLPTILACTVAGEIRVATSSEPASNQR